MYVFLGQTVDTVIAAMEARLPNQNTLYVEISRDRVELLTDDAKVLRRAGRGPRSARR